MFYWDKIPYIPYTYHNWNIHVTMTNVKSLYSLSNKVPNLFPMSHDTVYLRVHGALTTRKTRTNKHWRRLERPE